MTDPVGLEQLDDPGHLVDRPGLARVDGDPEAVLARPPEEALVIGDPERGGFGAGDVDTDDAPVTPADRLLHDDLVELVRKGPVEAEDEPGLDGVFQRRPVHPPRRRGDDVVEVLLAAAVALHRVEAELHRRHVVLAVGAADDLVDGALDGDRARLDEFRPVEELEIPIK